MSSRPRTLRGTRHLVKSRLAIVATLVMLALIFTQSSLGSSAGNTTSGSSSTTSAITSTFTTSEHTSSVVITTSTTADTTATLSNATSYSSTATSTIKATTTSTNPTTSSTSTTSSTPVTTTSTSTSTTTSGVQGMVYQVDSGILAALVNSTTSTFVRSVGTVPYYVVVAGTSVSGLVYLTTDVAPGSSWGYHGPVGILAYVNTTGVIEALKLWSSSEPRESLVTPQYLASYYGHSVFDNLTVGSDVLGITGATFTAEAIAGGVRDGGRIVVNDYAANPLPVTETTTSTTTTSSQTTTSTSSNAATSSSSTTSSGSSSTAASTSSSGSSTTSSSSSSSSSTASSTSSSGSSTTSTSSTTGTTTTVHHTSSAPTVELLGSTQFRTTALIVALFAAALLAYEFNSDKLRYGVLCVTLVFLGFYYGTMVSITDSVIFISRDFPPLTEYFWYVLYAAVLVTSLIWGRLYCGSICPFGAFTHLLYKVSPFHMAMPKKIQRVLLYLKYFVLVMVVLAVAEGALWATGVEPFLTFFFFSGTPWMWAVVGIAVALSVPFDRFYCSYICPAGAGLALAARLRVREINRWSECDTCKVCERGCPSGAISGGKISALECMNCRTCEVNYSNPDICPHYASQRVGNPGTGRPGPVGTGPSALVFSGENRPPS